jgi:hypothetical protein
VADVQGLGAELVVRASFFGEGCVVGRLSWLGKRIKLFSGLDKGQLIDKITQLSQSKPFLEKQKSQNARNLSQWVTALSVIYSNDPSVKPAVDAAEKWFVTNEIKPNVSEKVSPGIRRVLITKVADQIVQKIGRGQDLSNIIKDLKEEYAKLYPVAHNDVEKAVDEAVKSVIPMILQELPSKIDLQFIKTKYQVSSSKLEDTFKILKRIKTKFLPR